MRRGLCSLGALVLSLAAALPAGADDKPLTIQQKRDAVVERVLHGQEDKPWITSDEYSGKQCEQNSQYWFHDHSQTKVLAQKCDSGTVDRDEFIHVHYQDDATKMGVWDAAGDGLGPGDAFYVVRNFPDRSEIVLNAEYLQGDDVRISYRLSSAKGWFDDEFRASGLNPFIRLRLRKLRTAITTLGSDTYEQVLDDVLAGREPQFPIAELDALCSDLEPYLTRRFDDGAAKSLFSLARSYEKALLEKVKE